MLTPGLRAGITPALLSFPALPETPLTAGAEGNTDRRRVRSNTDRRRTRRARSYAGRGSVLTSR